MKKLFPFILLIFCITAAAAIFLVGCVARPTERVAVASATPDERSLDIRPFVEMAQAASCSDVKNRLYVIDNQFVFWTSVGNCSDAAYAHILYGSTPEKKLCSATDSIAGPQTSCLPEFDVMFQTILDNLDQPDLGLGDAHAVVLTDLLAP
jgi:hypothetical protein